MKLKEVLLDIQKTAKLSKFGQSVRLVAVSKLKGKEDIMKAYEQGQRDFGENYVEELINKQNELPKDINWHFIGHLQSNKVNKLLNTNVHMIQTVDSIKLAQKLNNRSKELNKNLNIMTQINISEEKTKAGINKEELPDLIDFITKECDRLVLRGFMILGEIGNPVGR